MNSITCKNCKWWEPWKLPEGKTLSDMVKDKKGRPTISRHAKRGDCRNMNNDYGATYSSTTCDFAEAKEE
jgi:hypothetical protein